MTTLPPAIAHNPHRNLTGQVQRSLDHYIGYGGLSDIYEGKWTNPTTGRRIVVAVKILRGVYRRDSADWTIISRRLNRESWVWDTLSHVNVLPFLGISNDVGAPGASPGLISPLCRNGNIIGYLSQNHNVDRLEMARGVATGLQYLHSQGVIHGDLKGSNVLVSDDGVPLLCDFGRSRIIGHRGFTSHILGTIDYQAPELIDLMDDDEPDEGGAMGQPIAETEAYNSRLTRKSDVYAYAMLALEILTGQPPYYYLNNQYKKMMRILQGEKPRRARYDSPLMTGARWDLFDACWHINKDVRPEMHLVIPRLG